jgi:hypothetical protein
MAPPFGGRGDARDGCERPALWGYASGLETPPNTRSSHCFHAMRVSHCAEETLKRP